VARAANVTYLTMQVRQRRAATCAPWWSASRRAARPPGQPRYLVAGRQITRGHYEAVADVAAGFAWAIACRSAATTTPWSA
jgi:putative ABC transport system permease protein